MTPIGWLLDILFPPKCPFCQCILKCPEDILCMDCQVALPWLTGKQSERGVDFAKVCISPLRYRGTVREAVLRYKFAGRRGYARPFGILMAQCAKDHWEKLPDGVTWVPLSGRRRQRRGYDQSELLARQIGAELNLPVYPTLKKIRHTNPQSHLTDSSARRANALGAYALLSGAEVAGLRLILVDDVVTSGSTLGECARVLATGGTEAIFCLTLAQSKNHK